MRGLFLKDFYILKGTISTTLTILIILIIYCLIRGYGIGLVIIPPLLFAATTTSSLKLDWSVDWDKKALTMPISRKEIVKSKYFELLFLSILGTIVGIISLYISNFFEHNLSQYLILNIGILSLALSILGGSFHIMFAYKFGGASLENSEILLFMAYGISVAMLAICIWGIKLVCPINLQFFSFIPVLILFITVFICAINYFLTVLCFLNKEM